MELHRYQAQETLPGFGPEAQRRLKDSRVLVVGLGGLGCPVALYLAAAGAGRMTLVDPDVVELSNLQRQVLYVESDVGRPKTQAAAQRLQALRSDLLLELHELALDAHNAAELVHGHDVVIDGTDRLDVRPMLDDACEEAGVPFVHGALEAFEGQVALFLPGGTRYRDLHVAPTGAPRCASAGVLGPVAGAVGMQMAIEALRVLSAFSPPRERLLLYDAHGSWDEVRLDPLQGRARRSNGRAPGVAAPSVVSFERASAKVPEPGRAGMVPGPEEAPPAPDPEEVDAAFATRPEVLLVDVRGAEERDLRGLPGSIHLPFEGLAAQWHILPKDRPIVLCCNQGLRGLLAARLLRNRGLRAHALRGGLAESGEAFAGPAPPGQAP